MSVASRIGSVVGSAVNAVWGRSTAETLAGVTAGQVGATVAYKGAQTNRLLSDWVVSLLHADDEIRGSARLLRLRARDLARNNAYVKQFLTALAVNVIGPCGAKHQAQVRNNNGRLNKAFNDQIEAAWTEWSMSPCRDGRLTLARFQHQLIKAVARDGEVFVRKHRAFARNRFAFAIEAIEADMIDLTYNVAAGEGQPEVRLGVEVDSDGRPAAYYMWDRGERQVGSGGRKRIRVPAEEIVHLYDPDRCNQTRGVTWMTSIMFPIRMLAGYSEAELVAARIGAAKMGFFKRKDGEGTALPEDGQDGLASGAMAMEANPGTFEILPDGYELDSWSPDHPNSGFGAFVKAGLREVATGLSMSYNALANDLEGVNYSSMRSGLMIERDVWRSLQEWWTGAFLLPIYTDWLNSALLAGAIRLDSRDWRKFQAVKFTPRGWPWVDPLKDAQAGILAVQSGFASRSMVLAEQGIDFEEVLEELAEEQKMAAEAGISISGPAAAPSGGEVEEPGEAEEVEEPGEMEEPGEAEEPEKAPAATGASSLNGSTNRLNALLNGRAR